MPSTDMVTNLEADGPMFICEPDWPTTMYRCWWCDPMWGEVRRHRHRRRDRETAWLPGMRVAWSAEERLATAQRRVDRRAARRRRLAARRGRG